MDRSLNEVTYDRLKNEIMTFALKPGDQVSAAKLAERYHVSRTPVREALVRLATEGLIEIYPQSKSVISRIDICRARQEWFIRKTLEMGMVDRFFECVTEKDIQQMEDYYQQMLNVKTGSKTYEECFRYLNYDNEFHAVSYTVSGEQLAAEVISNTRAHYSRIRLLVDMEQVFQDRTLSAHGRLIEYLRAGDRESYRSLLRKHLDYIVTDIERMREIYPGYFEPEK